MEYKEYYEAIEAFMREIDGLHVKSIGLVVYAVPRTASFGFTLDTKDMVIDLSRVIPYPDLLPNAKYVDGIGKLTVSILLNRFVKNCHRKELS